MKYSELGTTGIRVSKLGLGTVKFGRNRGLKYPSSFTLPTNREISSLLDFAKSTGINLLDTAPAYGSSEERLGKILKNSRKDWILCTKVGEEFVDDKSFFDFSPLSVRSSIERSLKRLNTDVLDIVLVHSNGEDKKIIEELGIFETLDSIKKSGLIRAFGMSTKTVEGGLLAVDHSDIVMMTYNPTYVHEKEVLDYAHHKNKGVLIKKALASGHLQHIADKNPVLETMRFIFLEPGVGSVVVGTVNEGHLKHNVECAESVSG